MMRRRPVRPDSGRRRGVSLIDAMAAVALLAILCVTISGLIGMQHRTEWQTTHRLQAVWLARSTMSYLRRHPDLLLADDTAATIPDQLRPGSLLPNGRLHISKRNWAVVNQADIAEITISISWGGPGEGRLDVEGLIHFGGRR